MFLFLLVLDKSLFVFVKPVVTYRLPSVSFFLVVLKCTKCEIAEYVEDMSCIHCHRKQTKKSEGVVIDNNNINRRTSHLSTTTQHASSLVHVFSLCTLS